MATTHISNREVIVCVIKRRLYVEKPSHVFGWKIASVVHARVTNHAVTCYHQSNPQRLDAQICALRDFRQFILTPRDKNNIAVKAAINKLAISVPLRFLNQF